MDFRKTRILDATTLKDYLHCPRRYYWAHVRNWKKDMPAMALHFGIAFHEGMAVLYEWLKRHPGKQFIQGLVYLSEDRLHVYYLKKEIPADADLDRLDKVPLVEAAKMVALAHYRLKVGPDELISEAVRTPGKLMELLQEYVDAHPSEPGFTVLEVERPFALGVTADGYTTAEFQADDTGGLIIPDDGRLFTWVGKMDLITKWSYGIMPMDHKTTSQLGMTYDEQWNPEVQMGGYVATAGTMFGPDNIYGACINAVQVAKKKEMRRIMTTRTEDQLVQHHTSIVAWAQRIDSEKHFPQNTTACSVYGGCPYLELCRRHPNPVGDETIIRPPEYVEEIWNPVEHIAAQ